MAVPNQSDHYICQFAVISDSHIRLIETAEEGGYQSNLLTVERAQYVVQCLNNLQPDFVIHLGDLVHPIPDLKIHEETVKKGRDLFSNIEAKFYALPGNHDIGDKPNAWLPAPVVGDKSHLIFEKYWGPTYQSFSTETCHFICLDTPIMNTGFDREKEQRSWLENELLVAKNKSLRIFIFMHYPLFICEPDEPTHYDNIDFPARSWLLEKFSQYNVEAVFSGHVHNAFVGVHAETLYYSLPSIAFVRPEYSELATVGPGDEYGRNDTAKLGFYLVRVYRDRHEIYPIRTYGAGNLDVGMPHIEPCQMAAENSQILGLTLRRGWGKPVELAA
ncbi:MAG: metallophosphoesterase, partial [Chloroflexota bacterium]